MTRLVFVDVETYYDREYSLRKMTPAEYVLDHRFECIGWAVAEGDSDPIWLEPQVFQLWLTKNSDAAFVSHNALFDMFVLAHRFNFVPKLMIDTLGMARATIFPQTGSVSLAKCAEHFGFPDKGTMVANVIGMGARAIKINGMWESFVNYAKLDASLCRLIFRRLMAAGFPMSELLVMDEILRACICPQLQLNDNLLYSHLAFVSAAKQGLLDRAGLASRETLMSNEMFAAALRKLGVDPPMKLSPTPGKDPIYAFAKTDEGMQELLEHPDPDVQALAAARIGNKTTLEETRTQRFIDHSRLTYPGNPGMWLPVPLKYSGAHTHRLSGDWKINLQNLTRGGLLRKSLVAPKGKLVVVADSSQVEARLTAWFCQQDDLVKQFASGVDVYCDFAGEVYKRPVTKANKPERFVGKTSILGLGYGMGGTKFELTIKAQSKVQNIQVDMDVMQATDIVNLYRQRYRKIPDTWGMLNGIIPQLARAVAPPLTLYPGCPVEFRPREATIIGPNGLKLYYHKLDNKDGDWYFQYGKLFKKLFGGKMLENIIQFLARIILMDAAIRIRKETGRHFALQVHDELVYVVDEAEASEFCSYLIRQISIPPSWGPDIPLAAEGSVAETYGDAK